MHKVKQTYDQMIRKSYGFNVDEQSHPDWNLMKWLYEKNYVQNNSEGEIIPKKIHQIWLGGKLPDIYKEYTESWQKFHPTWEYKLWTDKDVDSIQITKKAIYDYSVSFGMRSDILRYEILKKYGGLYVDTDFECLKPFDDLMNLNFFTSIGYDVKLQLYIGLIACTPQYLVIAESAESINEFYNGLKGSRIMNVTGANHFTTAFLKHVSLDTKGVVAFPMEFFYPFPNNVRENGNYKDYITEDSYAVHHWAISWARKGVKL